MPIATMKVVYNGRNPKLLIPLVFLPKQTYKTYGSILTVFCDRLYEAEDYIRDYDEFKRFRVENSGMENII